MRRLVSLFLLSVFCSLSALAAVSLPAFFSDGMVLQRDAPCPVWGKASPGESVTVAFRGQTVRTEADGLGHWRVTLSPTSAGSPFELQVSGEGNRVAIANVAVGEVWLASGQSNMGWRVEQSNDAEKEIAASAFPQIRFFQVARTVADTPQDDVKGQWQSTSPATAGKFSAAAYFFARDLHQKLGVPIGILQSEWGGTPAESWTSASALAADPALQQVFIDWATVLENHPLNSKSFEQARKDFESGKRANRPNPPPGPGHQHMPSGLYNAMIAPLVPYAIRGAIWYQGENNAARARAELYRSLFPAMIADWRARWKQGDFPFLYVQLANYARVSETAEWPELRDAQLEALSLANTGMAVAIDIGESQNIHPKNKQDIGRRLALAARAVAYGEDLVHSGPLFRQAAVEGNTIRVYFDHVGGGLKAKNGTLTAFEVAGKDGNFVPAEARIEGKTVVVSAGTLKEPERVRYAWANDPVASLYNTEGLPASPFQSK